MRCNEQSDFKYIPNYAPSVIAEFNDNHLIIKDSGPSVFMGG